MIGDLRSCARFVSVAGRAVLAARRADLHDAVRKIVAQRAGADHSRLARTPRAYDIVQHLRRCRRGQREHRRLAERLHRAFTSV
jgi:phage gp37-like protein